MEKCFFSKEIIEDVYQMRADVLGLTLVYPGSDDSNEYIVLGSNKDDVVSFIFSMLDYITSFSEFDYEEIYGNYYCTFERKF